MITIVADLLRLRMERHRDADLPTATAGHPGKCGGNA
jgi:hypothetical protein